MRTPRNKVRIAFVSWLASVIAVLMLFPDPLAADVLMFPAFFGLSGYLMSIKCPKCHKPVLQNPIELFGVKIPVWTCWVPRTCTKCGGDLK